jgi:ABC-type iron transport system FetAB ATPase subunit
MQKAVLLNINKTQNVGIMKTYLSFQTNFMKAKLETVKDNLIFAFGETHTLNGRENINETIDIVEELIRSADALTKSIQNLSQND